jgi:hypothetical protein
MTVLKVAVYTRPLFVSIVDGVAHTFYRTNDSELTLERSIMPASQSTINTLKLLK